jgi:CRISPR-associated protein Cas1
MHRHWQVEGVWVRLAVDSADLMAFIPLKPIPIKNRTSMIFIAMGRIDVKDNAFVVVDEVNSERMVIPVGSIACIMLEPGTRVSHAAVRLAATVGTLLIWVGESGVRLYASGQPGGARSDKLLYQAKLALDENLRLKVVRKMFELRFGEAAPEKRSVDQLRGIEGARVRAMYKTLASQYDVTWHGRNYDHTEWDNSDTVNKCLSAATSCLYGITEAAVLAAGYAPAIGFIHSGKPLSFVYDIADLFKFETVVPIAFRVAAKNPNQPAREVRMACRDSFRAGKILHKIIPTIEEVLAAGGVSPPPPPEDAQPPAIPEPPSVGDEGHRSG